MVQRKFPSSWPHALEIARRVEAKIIEGLHAPGAYAKQEVFKSLAGIMEMETKMIIGFGHRAECGKDAAASHLIKRYGFTRRAFGDSLKEAVSAIFRIPLADLHDTAKKGELDHFWGQTLRFILQKVATECMRDNYDQEIWVKSVQRHIIDNKETTDWVIPDVRFVNEARAIKDWGGTIVCITRPGTGGGQNVGIPSHRSELELDDFGGWDHHIMNNGTLDDLYDKVDDFMASLGVKPVVRSVNHRGQLGQN
jgi:hypothetical protein